MIKRLLYDKLLFPKKQNEIGSRLVITPIDINFLF